jgi:radical SAM superfamily enzyme YgiQ (UPF0313 family)
VVVAWLSVYDSLYDDVGILREAKVSGARTVAVLNDPYETLEEKLIAQYPFIDVAVRLWDRENTLMKVMRAFSEGEDLSKIKGVVFRDHHGQIINTGKSPSPQDLYHLVDSSSILNELPLEKYKEGWILSGKGCPYRCTFCLYRCTRHLTRNPVYVANELETLHSAGIKDVYVLDPNFLLSPEFAKKFSYEITKRHFKIGWRTDARVEHCNKNILSELSKIGLNKLIIGIESADPKILSKIMKDLNVDLVFKAYENLKKSNIIPIFHYMYGFPWDDTSSSDRIVKLAKGLPLAKHSVNWVRPLIGTPLYDLMAEAKLVPRLSLESYVNREAIARKTLKLESYELFNNFMYILSTLSAISEGGLKSATASSFFNMTRRLLIRQGHPITKSFSLFLHQLCLPFLKSSTQIPKDSSFFREWSF